MPLSLRGLRCLLLSSSSSRPLIVVSVVTAAAATGLGNNIPVGLKIAPLRPSSLVFPPLLTEPALALALLVMDETELERWRCLRVLKKSLNALIVGGGGGAGSRSDEFRFWSRENQGVLVGRVAAGECRPVRELDVVLGCWFEMVGFGEVACDGVSSVTTPRDSDSAEGGTPLRTIPGEFPYFIPLSISVPLHSSIYRSLGRVLE